MVRRMARRWNLLFAGANFCRRGGIKIRTLVGHARAFVFHCIRRQREARKDFAAVAVLSLSRTQSVGLIIARLKARINVRSC